MDETVKKFGRVDILVNNASYQVCLPSYRQRGACLTSSAHAERPSAPCACRPSLSELWPLSASHIAALNFAAHMCWRPLFGALL